MQIKGNILFTPSSLLLLTMIEHHLLRCVIGAHRTFNEADLTC